MCSSSDSESVTLFLFVFGRVSFRRDEVESSVTRERRRSSGAEHDAAAFHPFHSDVTPSTGRAVFLLDVCIS